jgi:hypothetical protein
VTALLAAAMLMATPSAAGPVPVQTGASLRLDLPGLGSILASGVGSVSVDASAGQVFVPAGVASLATPVAIPVTSSTAIFSLTAQTLSNLSGTFSLGGVTAQAPGELCGAGPASGEACVGGGGLGGVMGLHGTVFVHILPLEFPVPLNLSALGIGQGGSTSTPFTFDAAPWTAGVAAVNSGASTFTTSGTGSPLTLVSPTFVSALGNLLPVRATFTLDAVSVPEPATWVMLGLGLGLLATATGRQS